MNRQTRFDASALVFSWPLLRAGLLAALLLLLLTALPAAEAQGRCRALDSNVYIVEPSSGYFSGSRPLYNNRDCEPPSIGTYSQGPGGTAIAGSREAAIRICNAGNGRENNVGPLRFAFWWSCKPISSGSSGGSGRSGGSRSGSRGADSPPPTPNPGKLPMGNVVVSAQLGLNSGINFERYTHFNVGMQKVIDLGILDVVDVWGNANQYFEVCFPQRGAIVFLDASTSPRSLMQLTSFERDGLTCGSMDRAGTMVLVKPSTSTAPAKPSAEQLIAQSFIDSTSDPIDSAIDLTDCVVSTDYNLNLRREPWGGKLHVVRKRSSVAASARTQSWFKVTYEDIEGWIASWLVDTEGDCGWEGAANNSPALASSDTTATEGDPIIV